MFDRLGLLQRFASRVRELGRQHRAPMLFLAGSWCVFMAYLQLNALRVRADGIWAGHMNIWSDWPLHLGMATAFADRPLSQWLTDHPMFAHGPLMYPFAVNLLSGLLMRLGLGIDWSMTLPTLVASVATPLLLYSVYVQVLEGRRGLALLAVSLFYLGASLTGLPWLWNVVTAQDWSALAYPATELSRFDRYDWYSGNALTGMLLPQRAFVLGFPVGLLSVICLLKALRSDQSLRLSIAGGLLAGLLPIIHTHSFIALGFIGLGLALSRPSQWRVFAPYAGLAAALGGVLIALFLHRPGGLPNHMRWAPGFAAPDGFGAWLQMWWSLWGLFPFAAGLGVVVAWRRGARLLLAVAGGGLLCFVFANLFLVQPNRWDNSKIFLWAWFCWIPAATLLIGSLWSWRKLWSRGLSVLLLVALGTTGALELWRLARVDRGSYMIANRTELNLALRVHQELPPDAVFLTATTHNHPVMSIGGRTILLGFTGWIANLGFDHREREQDLGRMFAGGPAVPALLEKYGVDYVWIGPAERRGFAANEAWFAAHYPQVMAGGDNRIYAVGAMRSR